MEENTYIKTDLSIQKDGENYTVGRIDIGTFIRVPESGAKIIKCSNLGMYIKNISKNINIDINTCIEFLNQLKELDLIQKIDFVDQYTIQSSKTNNILFKLSKIIFSKPFVYTTLFMFVILTIQVCLTESKLFSGNTLLTNYPGMNILLLSLVSIILMINHEFGHYLGALSQSVNTKFKLSTRFIFIVMEAEMNNIWSISKSKRYIPLLGGPFFDIISLILSYTTFKLGLISSNLISTIISLIVLQFLFQFIIIFRTDLYYLILNYFNLPSLHEKSIEALKYSKFKKQNKTIKGYIFYIIIFSILFLLYFFKVLILNIRNELSLLIKNLFPINLNFRFIDAITGLTIISGMLVFTIYMTYISNIKRRKYE